MSEVDFALSFFEEEIRQTDDITRRIETIKKTKLIAVALGSKRTQSDLLPLLKNLLEGPVDLEDEFLFNLAEQYAVLLDYITDREPVVSQLERLASQEETCVREKAVESFKILLDKFGTKMADSVFKATDRLGRGESFCARVSACGLIASVYKHSGGNDKNKEDLRKLYITLCTDETPMVRRAAAEKLKDLVQVVEKPSVIQDLIPVYRQLVQEDTQDSIRVSCVGTAVVLVGLLNPEEMRQHCLSVITNASEDRSWRARLHVAKNFTKIAQAAGPEITTSLLLAPFLNLLKDSEAEVRCAALECTEHLAEVLSSEQMQSFIVPQFTSLGVDQNEKVRAEVARVLGPVATVLGREASQKLLLPLMLDLMKDEFHDVRLNMVASIGQVAEVLGMEVLVNNLLQHIQAIIMDNQWRIRYTVVQQMPALAKQFGQEVFKAKLEQLFLSSLTDSVQQVRQATIKNLGDIASNFGTEWAAGHLLPKIEEQYTPTSGYSSRLTILHAMTQLCKVMSPEQIVQLVIPTLVKGTKDTVPNVRFCACMMLAELIEAHSLGSNAIENVIKPALKVLLEDTDCEVQYFSSVALTKC